MRETRQVLTVLAICILAGSTGTAAQSRGWLGIGISCSYCEWQTIDGREIFHFSRSPVVAGLEPGGPAERAGIRVGDVLLAIDRDSLINEVGARRFADLVPSDTVRLTYQRGSETRVSTLIATARPESPSDNTATAVKRGPAPTAPVRFSGGFAGAAIEIRGSPDVSVISTGDECKLLILTPTARITLSAPKGCTRQSR